jgi:(S)-sulfolactate dehydrogenase
MATIVVSEYMAAPGLAELEDRHHVIYDPVLHAEPHQLRAALSDAAALIVRNRTQVDATLLDAAAGLVAVGRLGVGLDNIDTAACHARGIAVSPALGANAVAVAEYVLGSLLVLARPALSVTEAVRAGNWPRDAIVGRELAGKQLGLIGFGAVARAVASRALGLEMQLAAFDPFIAEDESVWSLATRMSLDGLMATSDAISIHVPLTPETYRLLNEDRIAMMRPDAVVINTSRGGIVDEAALAAALRSGTLGGAALDVFEHEPLDARGGATFADVPNLILTPHVAGHTEEANERISRVVATAVLQTLDDTG